jgi:hypothetical protein
MTKFEQTGWNNLQHYADCSCRDSIGHPSHALGGIHCFPDKLYVVTTVFNPLRFRNRYWNYYLFQNMVEKAGAILYTVEVAFGDRHFEVTDPSNPRHLQLRARDNQEIWLKENSLNLLIERLPSDWRYVAWIDADVSFARPDWAQETLHLLQHYDFLQMFSHAQDLGVNYEPSVVTPGFVTSAMKEEIVKPERNFVERYYYGIVERGKKEEKWLYRHPGFCWAARRSALDKVGGLIDWTVLGSGDWVMANALWGEVDKTIRGGYTEGYKNMCRVWEDRALRHIRKNVGYMPGLVNHYFHGEKKDRNYNNRWRLLVQMNFDPITDLKKDTQGLWQLQDDGTERFINLRNGLREYARLRTEDSNIGQIVP